MKSATERYADAIEARTIGPDEVPVYERNAVQEELLKRWLARHEAGRDPSGRGSSHGRS